MEEQGEVPGVVPTSHEWFRAFTVIASVFAVAGAYMLGIAGRSVLALLGGALAGVALAAAIIIFAAGISFVATVASDVRRRR